VPSPGEGEKHSFPPLFQCAAALAAAFDFRSLLGVERKWENVVAAVVQVMTVAVAVAIAVAPVVALVVGVVRMALGEPHLLYTLCFCIEYPLPQN
jgi:thiamine transporter ThiT